MARAQERELRENARENANLTDGWSDWVRAIVPEEQVPTANASTDYTKRNGRGWFCENVQDCLGRDVNKCGIYEWSLSKPWLKKKVVVYVGSTCRKKEGSLHSRIREYCSNGSHKKELINEAVEERYELYVRIKVKGNKTQAQVAENRLLQKYDYAWNKRENGEIRKIFP